MNPSEENTIDKKEIEKTKSPIWTKMDEAFAILEDLGKRIVTLEEIVDTLSKQQLSKVLPEVFKSPDAKPSEYKPVGYVPQKYRQIVDEILSSEFGLDCTEDPNSMDFTITIVVPQRYSSLTAQEKEMGVKDIRPKVISRAIGENGVRDWCNKVRDNLNRFYTSSGVASPFTKQ